MQSVLHKTNQNTIYDVIMCYFIYSHCFLHDNNNDKIFSLSTNIVINPRVKNVDVDTADGS